ncbi:MAG TPA: hypothetical protein VFC41_02650, partial [Anaerovoracaceae bacterium]|nr:hypothetical protein [Anaerovoracaceae bacterium]
YKDIAQSFSLGDVGLVISKKNIGQNSIPSKTWNIMAAELPVLASFDQDNEIFSVVQEANCGICVPAENKDALKNAILYFYHNRLIAQEMGINGRKYVLENLSKNNAVKQYVYTIRDCIERKN